MIKISHRDWIWIEEAIRNQSPHDPSIFSAWVGGMFGIEGATLQAAISAVEKKIEQNQREMVAANDDTNADLGNDIVDYRSILYTLKNG